VIPSVTYKNVSGTVYIYAVGHTHGAITETFMFYFAQEPSLVSKFLNSVIFTVHDINIILIIYSNALGMVKLSFFISISAKRKNMFPVLGKNLNSMVCCIRYDNVTAPVNRYTFRTVKLSGLCSKLPVTFNKISLDIKYLNPVI